MDTCLHLQAHLMCNTFKTLDHLTSKNARKPGREIVWREPSFATKGGKIYHIFNYIFIFEREEKNL